MGNDTQATTTVHRCGHHGNMLVDIDAVNPDTGERWGLRCVDCFPEAFPGYRRPLQRLAAAEKLLAELEADVENRRAYAGDPDPGGTRALADVVERLRTALAEHLPQ